MASEAHTTRRSLFAIAAGAALLPALPAMAATDNGARMLHLEREVRRLDALANRRGASEDEVDALVTEMADREVEIANAPCDCMDAFKVKLRTVVHSSLTQGTMYRVDSEALVLGMIAFIEGRH